MFSLKSIATLSLSPPQKSFVICSWSFVNFVIFAKKKKLGKKILICPLNWGLGHASRCVPIIDSLLKSGHTPIIAADKAPLVFLKKSFPNVETIKLPGFEPAYSKGNSQVFKLMTLIPGALRDFKKEHDDIETIVKERNIDIVISDNRFGCWSRNAHSIFITHQLHIQTPKFWRWTYPIINTINRNYIRHYDELWIPDTQEEPSLSGILSHPADAKIKTKYIGLLSRFSEEAEEKKKEIDYLVILSGPEPQRTILENIILEQAQDVDGKIVVLRAKPNQNELPHNTPSNVTFFNHADDKLFTELISKSKNIICRGGYSSLMDLVKLNRNAYLVPTPGQTEQEYLAQYLTEKGLFNYCKQKDFHLKNVSVPQHDLKSYFKEYEIHTFIDR